GLADRSDTGPVSLDAGRAALLGPPAIAVHDDGDVARELRQVDLVQKLTLERAGGRQDFQVDHGKRVTRRLGLLAGRCVAQRTRERTPPDLPPPVNRGSGRARATDTRPP